MPERKNRAMSGLIDVVQVEVAVGLPAYRASDDLNCNVSDPADEPGFKTLHSLRGSHRLRRLHLFCPRTALLNLVDQLRHLFATLSSANAVLINDPEA